MPEPDTSTVPNLYVHFPFCRRKCTYCALHSRAGTSADTRTAYIATLADAARQIRDARMRAPFSSVYFGGGSPALCDLAPLIREIPISDDTEFTVELHPLDATPDTLKALKDYGVNRISMGVQSLDDTTLAHMRRGHTVTEAERAFELVRSYFDNAGIDLIIGYPAGTLSPDLSSLRDWGLSHCSVYSLILEERSILAKLADTVTMLPSDDAVMDELRRVADFLATLGLERYEISNYALPGQECRHNLAVWNGEDYIGLGEGAHGRIGLFRTENFGTISTANPPRIEEVSPETDKKERTLFRLRTRNGIDASDFPDWIPILDRFASEGLLRKTAASVYTLTSRGTEVCDSILTDLI